MGLEARHDKHGAILLGHKVGDLVWIKLVITPLAVDGVDDVNPLFRDGDHMLAWAKKLLCVGDGHDESDEQDEG